MAYINKKELEALHIAWETCNNVLEGTTADENSDFVKDINKTLSGLNSLIKKARVGIYSHDASALPIPDVSVPVCHICDTPFYYNNINKRFERECDC